MTGRAPKGAGWQAVKENGHANGANRGPVDLARGYLPIIVVCTMLVFVSVIAYQAGAVMNGYAAFQANTEARFTAIGLQLADISKTVTLIRDQQLQGTKK
jgi:hypothetical protein